MASTPACKMCGYGANGPQAITPPVAEVHPSSILHFLNSNDAPSGTTKIEVQLSLAIETERLAILDASITKVRLELLDLMKQRDRTEYKMKDYKFILHPIRRLSADILSYIFLYSINEDLEEDVEESSIDPTYIIWRLPRVSRTWRSVALSSCRLWSTIRIVLTDPSIEKAQFMLSMQLQRSGIHPLSVSLHATNNNFVSRHSLLQILFPSSQRWRNLMIYMPALSYKKLLPWVTSFSTLTSIHVWSYCTGLEDDVLRNASGITDIVISSPRIKVVYTAAPYISRLKLPLQQIEEFYCLSKTFPSECLASLRALPYLGMCEFYYTDHDEETQGLEEVYHPHLHKLIIRNGDDPSPIFLLRYLRLPSLNYLELEGLNSVDKLQPFLKRSHCRLTRLRLSSQDLTDTDCIRLFKTIPSLTFLTLHCPQAYTQKLLKCLGNNDEKMLPSLQFLEMEDLDPHWSRAEVLKLKKTRPDVRFFGDASFVDD